MTRTANSIGNARRTGTNGIFADAIPSAKPADIIAWADTSGLKVDGHSFDSMRTPQLLEPMRAMADFDTRIGTLIKPVQIGGSTAGEVVAAWWAAFYHGLIQYNWQDDLKAKDRWHDRITKTLNSCRDIKRTGNHLDELICEARFINSTVRVQGVFNESALDSDTVPLQINEEIHLWKPGFLGKARRRQTQVWNAKAFDISNASNENDQLHIAYEEGTQEVWEVKCPNCEGWHEMHFRFDKAKPGNGGLRWDSEGCKTDSGRYNYNKLEATIRYQFPCGGQIADVACERRRIQGRYRTTNDGAHLSHRSWNFQAVSCDAIRWLTLIQEWHQAIRGMKSGDIQPMRRFVTERECRFWSDELAPFSSAIVLKSEIKKSREGLVGRAVRLWAADKQRGYKSKGELSHYWLVIRDVMPNSDSQLVFEGQVSTDTELLAVLDEHKCERYAGGVDGTWDTKNVKELCFRNGLNMFAANQSHKGGFLHKDGVRRFYDDGKLIHLDLNLPPRFDYTYSASGVAPGQAEPTIISYNLAGMLENFFFIRSHERNVTSNGGDDFIRWDVPSDVSEDYQKQIDCWERVSVKQRKTNDEVEGFRKRYEADHMTMCEAYIAMMMEIGGFISSRLTEMGVERSK